MPTFSVEGYQDIKIAKPETDLTEDEYKAELERVRDSRAAMEPVTEDRALVDGDWAQITFRGEFMGEDGQPAAAPGEPIKGEDVVVEVGGEKTLATFNDALRGAKPGQELKFEVTYPADFGEHNLAGKTVAYDVEVKAIKKRIVPELNDDFAKELGRIRDAGCLHGEVPRAPGQRQAPSHGGRSQGQDDRNADRQVRFPGS